MTRLTAAAYLAHVRHESDRLRSVLSAADPDARVPACPDWTAADLLHHLTGVQTFWAEAVEGRPAEPAEVDRAPAASYEAMLVASAAATDRLVRALTDVAPDDETWTWSPDHTAGFVLRRQAHEALVHRRDAEQAAGVSSPVDAALAADGVDEVLDVMFGGHPAWGTFTPYDVWVRVDAVDDDQHSGSTWVRLGRFTGTHPDSGREYDDEDIAVVADPGVAPDAVVTATAADLDLWLWRRRDDTGVVVTGDRSAYDRFRAVVDQPLD